MFQAYLCMVDQYLPGRYKGNDVTVVDVFEAVGKYAAGGQMSDRRT